MKVQLQIVEKSRGLMTVRAYKVNSNSREMISHFTGTIVEIKNKLEEYLDEYVEIEKSPFAGWY